MKDDDGKEEKSKTVDVYEKTSMMQDNLEAYFWNANFESDF